MLTVYVRMTPFLSLSAGGCQDRTRVRGFDGMRVRSSGVPLGAGGIMESASGDEGEIDYTSTMFPQQLQSSFEMQP